MNDRFTDLCIKYHTPKAILPTNALSHNYAPTYNRIFAGRPIRRILEIGLGYQHLFHKDYQSAGSLLLWEELFPEAEIFGIDIRPDALRNERRIRSWQCDQSNEAQLRAVAAEIEGNLDLVVDDGSHDWEHQKLTARVFVPELSPTGAYLIEDVVVREDYSDFPFACQVIECSAAGTYDDRLILHEVAR